MDPVDHSVSSSHDILKTATPDAADQTIKPEASTTAQPLPKSQLEVAPSQSKEEAGEAPTLRFDRPFLAAHSAYTRSQPHPDKDLIDQYGLSWLAKTVARTDPVTGEKINKIRKSYEGQIKAFALAGRNKAIKWDTSQGPSIKQLAQAPPEDYYNSRVAGKEVSKGFSTASLSRLHKVLELVPGPVPRNGEWENALGIDKTKSTIDEAKVKKQEVSKEAPQIPMKVNGHLNGVIANSKDSDANRPKRASKKRRYNDESFEGYGEGFDDEDDGSSDDASRRSMGSQQKKLKTAPPSYS